jgi:hypothetical protein
MPNAAHQSRLAALSGVIAANSPAGAYFGMWTPGISAAT